MLDVYSWDTPNGQKVIICLEELAIPYRLNPINIRTGDQHEAAFREQFPNGKIPAVTDRETDSDETISLFDSGAILLYLAENSGQLQPSDRSPRAASSSWLFWQRSAPGP